MRDQIGPSGLRLAALLLLLQALALVVGPAGGHRALVAQPGDSGSVGPPQHLLGHQHQPQRRPSSRRQLQRQKLRHRSAAASQQVPEQLPPIVVSSSDNSYVSASPFESTTTTSSPPLSPRPPASSKPPRRRLHLRRNKLFSSSSNELRDDFTSALDISSDISTTATTTSPSRPRKLALGLGEELDDEEEEEYGDDDDDEDEEEEEEEEEVAAEGAGEGHEERGLPKKSHSAVGSRFNVKPATIIKTRESIQMGATLINYTLVTNLNACLVECWITDSCDTAIYQESPVDFSNQSPSKQRNSNAIHTYLSSSLTRISGSALPSLSTADEDADGESSSSDRVDIGEEEEEEGDDDDDEADYANDNEALEPSETLDAERRKRPARLGFFVCYLFQCAKPDGFKCQFSAHNHYTSSMKATMPPHRARPRPPLATSTTTPTSTSPEDEQVQFNQIRPLREAQPQYAQIINRRLEVPMGQHNEDGRWLKSRPGPANSWRLDPVHRASISIEQEDYNQYAASAGLNGAIVAILVGIGATGMIIVVVGHKMKSIRQRIAYKASRANKRTGPLLPPNADYLITTMPMHLPGDADDEPASAT